MEWKTLSNKKSIELSSYLKEWMEKNPSDKIYIGCDSQNSNGKTTFATVIVLHHPTRGGHVLYSKTVVPRVPARYERLWKEVELSVEAAHEIISYGIQSPDYIDIDLNPDPRHQSNTLLRSAVGLIEGMGFKTRYKGASNWSISIADYICK
jgi:predicted RNase H-related nuclease YkuK (DUF458 family)